MMLSAVGPESLRGLYALPNYGVAILYGSCLLNHVQSASLLQAVYGEPPPRTCMMHTRTRVQSQSVLYKPRGSSM